jgi:hypothetical protein
MELAARIELATPSLPRKYSTTEPREHLISICCIHAINKNGAGEEIRTLDIHLGRVALYQLSYARRDILMVARGGFEPPKADAGRFTVCSLWPLGNHAIN